MTWREKLGVALLVYGIINAWLGGKELILLEMASNQIAMASILLAMASIGATTLEYT